MTNPKPIRVLQFGEGNFLRGFVDWMFDVARQAGEFDGSVVVVQPIARGTAALLDRQAGRYTLVLQGLEDGQPREIVREISCISRAISAVDDWPAVLELAGDADLRYVVSNTTEVGITYQQERRPEPGVAPMSFPAKVTEFLFARFSMLGPRDEAGLVFLPCELIERAGGTLREIVLRLAGEWRLPDAFAEWIGRSCAFCDTLVDRIVSGLPADDIAAWDQRLGHHDPLLCVGELYHQWVIQAPAGTRQKLRDEFPPVRAGMNVLLTDDLGPYRTQKVRLLNGGHTSSVLLGSLAGFQTVGEMMADPTMRRFLSAAMLQEIVPTLPLPREQSETFAHAVLTRFENPFLRHRLEAIAQYSVSKWRVRVLPSLLGYVERFGRLPRRLTLSLAGLLAYYQRKDCVETESTLARLADHRAACEDTSTQLNSILADESLWGQDLTKIPGLTASVAEGYKRLMAEGADAAVTATQ